MELNADCNRPGEEGNASVVPSNLCGIPQDPETGYYAGEMVCLCLAEFMNYPKTFDIVVNLFGADSSCSDPMGDVCVEYFSDGNLFHYDSITGVFDWQGKGVAGNYGAGDFPQASLTVNDFEPDAEPNERCGAIGAPSVCWILVGKRSDGRTFVNRGPGRAPSKFIIPDDVNPDGCKLFEDGKEIRRKEYMLLHDSVAQSLEVETTKFIKGRRLRGKAAKEREKQGCRKCKKQRKKKRIFL
jgi:hypothetical protein